MHHAIKPNQGPEQRTDCRSGAGAGDGEVIEHDGSNPQLNWPPCSLSYPPLLLLDGKTTQGRGGTSRTEWTAYYQTTDARGAIVLSDGKQEEQASACTVTIN